MQTRFAVSLCIVVCFLAFGVFSTEVKTLVGLKQQNLRQAEDLLLQISNPRSEKYGKYLLPTEIGSILGASEEAIQDTINFLKSIGGKSITVYPTRDWIEVSLPLHLALEYERSIPEPVRRHVELIQSLHNHKRLHIVDQDDVLHISSEKQAPSVFAQQGSEPLSLDLWILPATRNSNDIQQISVELEQWNNFDSPNEPTRFEMLLTPGKQIQCGPCSELPRKPFSKSFLHTDFCEMLSKNALVCFAESQSPSEPIIFFDRFSPDQLWTVSSKVFFHDGSFSSRGYYGTFKGEQNTQEKNPNLTPVQLAATSWAPNDQKQQYNQDPSLVATSTATQIVWGTGSFGYSESDLSQFYNEFSIPGDINSVKPLGKAGDSSGNNYVEAALDIEYLTAFAPQMNSACVNTDNNTNAEASTGFGAALLEFTVTVNQNSNPPNVISMSLGSLSWASCNILCQQAELLGASSYSDCLTYVQGEFQVCTFSSAEQVSRINTEFMKMGMSGVSLFGASGDGGNHFSFGAFSVVGPNSQLARTLNEISCNYTLPTFPAGSPWVTAVGATQMVSSGSKYVPIGCSTSTGGGITGGCGFSWQFPMPSYQTSVVQGYLSAHANVDFGIFNASGRAYPDISGIGASIPIVVNGIKRVVGGTSASAPTLAGIFSLINDQRLNSGLPVLGFINTRLYQQAQSFAAQMFDDVTSGSSECGIGKCCATGFVAGPGWDAFTGWGNPDFKGLLDAFMD